HQGVRDVDGVGEPAPDDVIDDEMPVIRRGRDLQATCEILGGPPERDRSGHVTVSGITHGRRQSLAHALNRYVVARHPGRRRCRRGRSRAGQSAADYDRQGSDDHQRGGEDGRPRRAYPATPGREYPSTRRRAQLTQLFGLELAGYPVQFVAQVLLDPGHVSPFRMRARAARPRDAVARTALSLRRSVLAVWATLRSR